MDETSGRRNRAFLAVDQSFCVAGAVTEVHPELGPAAQKNLAGYPQVTMHATDGSQFDPGECDAMLINAGVTHPLPVWLDCLREGGCLVVPITVSMGMGPNLGKGVMLKITRRGDNYAAQVVTFVAIYSAIGARDPALEPALGKALATGALMKMKSVRRDQHAQEESCVVHGPAVCISLAEAAAGTQ